MTISDAAPHNRLKLSALPADAMPALLCAENSVDFAIGSESSAIEAMNRAGAAAAMALPHILQGVPDADRLAADVQAVLTELVDVTARHTTGCDLVARLAYDGWHVGVSVGEMECALPAPEEEPGLYLVHRVAPVVRQHKGPRGGLVTWAAVAA